MTLAHPAFIDLVRPRRATAVLWRRIVVSTWREFNDDQITNHAAGVAFFALLALFPALGALVSLYGFFADAESASEQLKLLSGVLPPGASTLIGTEMLRLATAHEGSLTLRFVAGLALSIWSASAGIRALMNAMNVAYEVKERRGFIKVRVIGLIFTVGAFLFVLTSLLSLLAAPGVLRWFGLDIANYSAPDILRWPALFILTSFALSILYRYGPGERRETWRWISPGSGVASLVWLVMSMLFSAYVTNFAHYDRTYGSLAAVVGLMIWLWLSVAIFLGGAELNSEIRRQHEKHVRSQA
jgi:membrane protein